MENANLSLTKLRNKLRFFQAGLLLCAAFCLFLSYKLYRHNPPVPAAENEAAERAAVPPHYQEIMNIIRPLRYSGLYSLIRPEVRIEPDFENGIWYIRNLHRFDEKGGIKLGPTEAAALRRFGDLEALAAKQGIELTD